MIQNLYYMIKQYPVIGKQHSLDKNVRNEFK